MGVGWVSRTISLPAKWQAGVALTACSVSVDAAAWVVVLASDDVARVLASHPLEASAVREACHACRGSYRELQPRHKHRNTKVTSATLCCGD
eukprot:5642417-Amphidinium_carterae.1